MQGNKVNCVWGPYYSGGATLIDSPVLGVQEQGIADSRVFEALTVNPIVHTAKLPARMAAFPWKNRWTEVPLFVSHDFFFFFFFPPLAFGSSAWLCHSHAEVL